MRRNITLLVILIILVSALATACGKDEGPKTITGTLDSWDTEAGTVTIEGQTYPVAEKMKDFADQAEAGQTYEFTFDEHSNIVGIQKAK